MAANVMEIYGSKDVYKRQGGAHGPVVVLAAAVHAFKGLLVLQADQTVLGCDLAHHFHGQQRCV